MNFRETFDNARLRAGAMLREHKERAAERKAARPVDPPGAPSESLISSVKLGAWGAYIALMWFLWERVLHVSEAQFETLRITNFLWLENLTLSLHFPLIIGYVFVVLTVPFIAKFAIPMMVSLSFREHFWAKSWAVFITLLVSIVLISGTATVGGMAVVESERESAVAVEQVQTGRAVLEARIASRERELSEMMNNRNAYLAQAASVGAVEWERSYVAQARTTGDARLPMIERALGAARSADTARADIQRLREELASSTAVAAVASDVTTARSAPIAGILGWLNAFWILLLAVVMDIACLFLPWLAETLQQKRNRVLSMAGGIPQHPWMIQDQRAEGNVARERQKQAAYDVAEAVIAEGGDRRWAEDMARAATQPKPPTTRVTDAETGEELVQVKPHWRKLKRGQKHKVETTGEDPLPDETGVEVDGGNRQASVNLRGQPDAQNEASESREGLGDAADKLVGSGVRDETHNAVDGESDRADEASNNHAHEEPPFTDEPSPEDIAAYEELDQELETPPEPVAQDAEPQGHAAVLSDAVEHVEPPQDEGDDYEQQEEEQADSHVRARALLAAK